MKPLQRMICLGNMSAVLSDSGLGEPAKEDHLSLSGEVHGYRRPERERLRGARSPYRRLVRGCLRPPAAEPQQIGLSVRPGPGRNPP